MGLWLDDAVREQAIRERVADAVVAIPADTGSEDSVKGMVARVMEDLGGIDILVNAAAQPGDQILDRRLAHW